MRIFDSRTRTNISSSENVFATFLMRSISSSLNCPSNTRIRMPDALGFMISRAVAVKERNCLIPSPIRRSNSLDRRISLISAIKGPDGASIIPSTRAIRPFAIGNAASLLIGLLYSFCNSCITSPSIIYAYAANSVRVTVFFLCAGNGADCKKLMRSPSPCTSPVAPDIPSAASLSAEDSSSACARSELSTVGCPSAMYFSPIFTGSPDVRKLSSVRKSEGLYNFR